MRWIHWHSPFHLQHFSQAHIDTMAGRAGLRRVAVRSWTPVLWVASNLRSALFPAKTLPDRRLYREVPTEAFLLLRLIESLIRAVAGGDALELVYELDPARARANRS